MTGGMRADEAGDGRTSPVASSDPVQQQQPAQPAQPAQPRTVTLLRRPSSGPGHPRSPTLALALALAAGSTTATATARAASEGTGGGQRSPTPDAAYRHPHAPEDGDGDGDDADARSPPSDSRAGSSSRASSSSPAPSTPAEPERLTTGSSAAGLRAGNDDDPVTQSCPPLDDALVLALGLPKDRLLLLRAEMEMERFVADAERTRLPLAPPHFAPGLNSYQRLLVHRLADTFGITREVEPSPRPLGPAAIVVPTAALVVLVKGPDSRLPLQKLSSYLDVPAPAPLTSASSPPSPSSSSTHLPAPTTQHKYKILPRHHATSSASSSTGADDDSARGGRARRDKSLEEREQAYKEARERIFRANEERITRPSSAGSTYSRAESASTSGSVQQQQQQQQPVFYPPQVMQQTQYSHQQQQQQQQRPPQLRPSAPSFDPHGGGWTPYAYGPEFPQVDYSYGWPHEQTAYGGGGSGPADWAAQQRRMPPFDPRASTSNVPGYAYQQQPPIQVTAPSPHPHPHPYALPLAGPAPQYPTHSPQPWVQRPPIPSPALSTSSGGSAGGYLMRFPDPTASGGNVTPGSTHRSVSSTSISSASSTSTSRNASTSSLPRRTTHSASHSLSSNRSDASGSVRRSASASTDGSGEPPAAAPTASKAPLHPSLPAKPGWLTALPPPVERTSHDRKSSFGSNTSSAPPSHPHTPPSFPPAPELYNAPPPTQFYPPPQWQHSPDPYYPPQQQPQVFYHPAPDQQTFYHHPTPPPPPLDAELGPEMRRPPPRSTLLFNPNDPGPGGNMKRSGSGGGRGASRIPQPKSVAGTDGIERGVDKIGLVG